METPETVRPPIGENVRLVYFGQIRPYKNVEQLAGVIAEMEGGAGLLISGHGLGQGTEESNPGTVRAVRACRARP